MLMRTQVKPHWALGALGLLLLGLIGYVATAGGPEKAWLGVRAVISGHPPPKIISVEPERRAAAMFVVAIRNPATEDVVITGYMAVPILAPGAGPPSNVSDTVEDGGGSAPVVTADEQLADSCAQARIVRLPRPAVIEPGRTLALRIRPWSRPCRFEVAVNSDHGTSNMGELPLDIDLNAVGAF